MSVMTIAGGEQRQWSGRSHGTGCRTDTPVGINARGYVGPDNLAARGWLKLLAERGRKP